MLFYTTLKMNMVKKCITIKFSWIMENLPHTFFFFCPSAHRCAFLVRSKTKLTYKGCWKLKLESTTSNKNTPGIEVWQPIFVEHAIKSLKPHTHVQDFRW